MTIKHYQLGYCTNVHSGSGLEQTLTNLKTFGLEVKQRFSPQAPMGIGLWLSAAAADKLVCNRQADRIRDWLLEVGLIPFTFNGFPFGDFHEQVVKYRVYEPTWWQKSRLEYTLDLISIQHALLPEGTDGSISTLPVAWGSPSPSREQLQMAANHLAQVAARLARLERETGRYICLCLEPEPGCVLQRSRDVVRFFHDFLWPTAEAEHIRRYLKVCHDMCHAAVMFEPQNEVFRRYQTAAIGVGKLQVSSAVATPILSDMQPEARREVFQQLSLFREDRYLHQTSILSDPSGDTEFFDDLPTALESRNNFDGETGEWRVHFHIPIYLKRFGLLRTTSDDIIDCLKAARTFSDVTHFEVETYAWSVLPSELRQPNLASGIADELQWFVGCFNSSDCSQTTEESLL